MKRFGIIGGITRFGLFGAALALLCACGGGTSYVHADNTTLGRVVVYRNGIAYFERYANVTEDSLALTVPGDKVDDFLKSLTVVDAKTGQPAPIAYPTSPQAVDPSTGLVDMKIELSGPAPHNLKLSYVTESPSWKPSYRIVVGTKGKVNLQAWAIVDNTSGEDWKDVKLGVGSSSALSFRFDLRTVRFVQRETLHSDDLFALAPPTGGATHGRAVAGMSLELSDDSPELARTTTTGGQYAVDEVRSYQSAADMAPQALPPPPSSGGSEKAATMAESVVVSGSSAGVTKGPARPRRTSGKSASKDSLASGNYRESPVTTKSMPKPATMPQSQQYSANTPMPQQPGGYPQQQYPQATPYPQQQAQNNILTMAQKLKQSRARVVIEGYADQNDSDKFGAALARANRVRDQLIQNGVSAEQLIAVGNGERADRKGGVKIVEAKAEGGKEGGEASFDKAAALNNPAAEPIGTSHFDSETGMTVPRGTSAMVSIVHTDTEGEVVFFYDPESTRGNSAFPFRAIRLRNPTDSVLESGPVTVFGEGKFIGEGLSDPIPARSIAFVPFALDKQIVVDKEEDTKDEIARIITVQRGVFSTEIQHTRRIKLTLNNRLDEKATVYLRHTVQKGYKLVKAPTEQQRLGASHLFKIDVAPNGKSEVLIEEATPIYRTTDIRGTVGIGLIKAYLTTAAEGKLKTAVTELIKLQNEIENLEQQIGTMRQQMQEYRLRMDELHAQIVTLKAVKTSGGNLMTHLEKKLQEVSEKLSKATVDLVGVQEKLMVARIRFQDGVAELSLEKTEEPTKPETPAGPAKKI